MSSAILKIRVSTPAWVSLRLSSRARSRGPISEMVVRTGWPATPSGSQKTTGIALVFKIRELQVLHPLGDFGVIAPRLAQPGQVALDVRHKNGHPDAAEVLRQDPERHRLPRARGPGHQPVPVGHLRQNADVGFSPGDEQGPVGLGHIHPPLLSSQQSDLGFEKKALTQKNITGSTGFPACAVRDSGAISGQPDIYCRAAAAELYTSYQEK